MRRTVYNSPSDNQDSNDSGGIPTSPSGHGTGGLPEGWQPRSPSPSDNLPPRLTMEEMLVQQRIENQIRENNRRRSLEPSNGQAGGTEQQLGDFRRVKPRNDPMGVNGGGGNPDDIGFAGARGNPVIAEQIASQVPLNEIVPPQNNNTNTNNAPPHGVDRPLPPIVPQAPDMNVQRVAVPANTSILGVNAEHRGDFFQNMYNRTFTTEQQQRFLQAQQPVQLTPEQQAGQQRILEAQRIVADSLLRAAEALERVREAQQRALDLQIELTLQRQAALPITADLPRPAPQPTATQNQVGQSREITPETFPIRPPVDRSSFSGTQPGGGKEGRGL